MANLNLQDKKFITPENLKLIINYGLGFASRVKNLEDKEIAPFEADKLYTKDSLTIYDGYIYKAKVTNQSSTFNEIYWDLIGDEITELTKDDIKDMLGLTAEEINTLSKIILDSEVRLDKTYSSSKIYTDIQNAIDTAKTYTLTELGKISGASYKIASSTSDMTDEKVIYLLQNGSNYDMYIVDSGTPTRIGDVSIDLSDYYTKTEVDNDFLKKTDATSTYATKIEINDKVDKTSIKTAISTTPSNDNVLSEKYIDENIVKKTDITTTIDDTSTDSQMPSAKAVYNATVDKNLKTYTSIEQLGLTTPTTVGAIYNAIPANSCLNIFASLSSVTDLPLQQGLLSITKISTAGFDIIFKRSGSGSVTDNAMYIGQLKGVDGTGLSWKKVCTTRVEDVTETNLTLTSVDKYKFTYENNNTYLVKNAICYVKFDITVVSPVSANASTSERKFCTLPKANMDTFNSVTCYNSTTLTNIYMQVGVGGYLSLWGGTAGHRYIGSFSYPVKES